MVVIFNICAFIFAWNEFQLSECSIRQGLFRVEKQKYLPDHVIETTNARSGLECGIYCLENESCASVNYKTFGINDGLCELNRETRRDADEILNNPEFEHIYVIERVRKKFVLIRFHTWKNLENNN